MCVGNFLKDSKKERLFVSGNLPTIGCVQGFSATHLFATGMGLIFLVQAIGCDDGAAAHAAGERAQAQVRRIAADLDSRTTETGVYIRVKENEIKEHDPWDTPVQVRYAQGGVAEVVSVRSAGPDRQFHTADDVVAQGMATNLKGIGT